MPMPSSPHSEVVAGMGRLRVAAAEAPVPQNISFGRHQAMRGMPGAGRGGANGRGRGAPTAGTGSGGGGSGGEAGVPSGGGEGA